MPTITVNNNIPQQQCPNYVVIGGGQQVKYANNGNTIAIANTGPGIYGYGWIEGQNSIASFGYTSCTGIITRHDNGRITLAHVFPDGYSTIQKNAYKEWLNNQVGGQIQNIWLVGGKNSQNPNDFSYYIPAQYNGDLVYIGPIKINNQTFNAIDVLCTPNAITIRCRPQQYNNWSNGFVADGAAFNNNFRNNNGNPFLGAVRQFQI
ncbi:hypothetical protein PN466_16200 [Roseofilum reptotaenium CS-1145]|uniref:Uncharacterized protein n=1 Tax=Roseofilum reptotaenium AO1-A TaxID=1925591 RepID=A0A1L9QWP0_9CYAN|nr:hypothetical protein [Roseofilum reptotaenium]MDB9518487.1 hypothetical protein [Roseofilum reptotaenium CS-1145]OJJ27098.1 hypothetical protein BI308_03370 [Roseofilum reptotaenium AO1-A]